METVRIPELLPSNRRRSKRVQRRIPIMVRFQDADKRSISEKSTTAIVNDHGALILMAGTVKPQQIIRIENLATEQELLCRVVSLGPSFMGKTQVAVEFILPTPGFWGAASKPKG